MKIGSFADYLTEMLESATMVIVTPVVWEPARDGSRQRYILLISGTKEGPPFVDRFDLPEDRKEAEMFRSHIQARLLAGAPTRVIIDTDDEREAVRVATTLWPNDQGMRRIGQEMDNDPAGIH